MRKEQSTINLLLCQWSTHNLYWNLYHDLLRQGKSQSHPDVIDAKLQADIVFNQSIRKLDRSYN